MLTIFLVVWMERNRRIFEKARDEEVDLLSDKVHFWDSLGHLGLLSLGIIFFMQFLLIGMLVYSVSLNVFVFRSS